MSERTWEQAINEIYQLDEWTDETPAEATPATLRKKYPALKDAWDQYKMVLALCRAEEQSK